MKMNDVTSEYDKIVSKHDVVCFFFANYSFSKFFYQCSLLHFLLITLLCQNEDAILITAIRQTATTTTMQTNIKKSVKMKTKSEKAYYTRESE